MPTYVALLRAVNVGGTGKLAMSKLKSICADAGFARVEIALQRDRLGNARKAENPALLGGLDDIGAHPLAVDARNLGMPRQHRL